MDEIHVIFGPHGLITCKGLPLLKVTQKATTLY